MTVTPPAVPEGVAAVKLVLLTNVTPVAIVLPNWIVAPETKLAPVMVTDVPPLAGPEFGDTELSVGVGVAPPALEANAAICITQAEEPL